MLLMVLYDCSINMQLNVDDINYEGWDTIHKAAYCGNYEILLNYKDRYHGIGFHLISQPIQILLAKFVPSILLIRYSLL